jgi:hypothetical protein
VSKTLASGDPGIGGRAEKKIREKEKKLVQFHICCILLLRRPANNSGLTKNLLKSV